MMKTLAESGVFNLPDHTPMESAKRSNLYEAFNYIAAKTAIQNIQ